MIEKIHILARKLLFHLRRAALGSVQYWETRYALGGNSGAGSYSKYAEFKAEVINDFLSRHLDIRLAIEFGCGDGNQLSLIQYPKYIGLDVSPTAVRQCIARFRNDPSKSFFLYQSDAFADHARLFQGDLAISLDVLFHLVEGHIYEKYLADLFSASRKYVIIYASNQHVPRKNHELHREFLPDALRIAGPDWQLLQTVPNRYPASDFEDTDSSLCSFFFFELR